MEILAETVNQLMHEVVLSTSEAARFVKTGRTVIGRGVSPSTVRRWITRGIGGIHLEGYLGPGGGWLTSEQAISRFFAAITTAATATENQRERCSPSGLNNREKRARQAEIELEKVLGKRK